MTDTTAMPPPENRTARKHRAIIEAATKVFLSNGYVGASMDEVAAVAAVSKQTVYKHFADKERLFAEVVLSSTAHVDGLVQSAAATLERGDDVGEGLRQLARLFLGSLMRPEAMQLRRLIIAEADRFPELGGRWFDSGFERVLATLTSSFQRLNERGLLHADDPRMAAEHFAGLLLWIPMNRIMFRGGQETIEDAELEHLAEAGMRVFLAAYGAR